MCQTVLLEIPGYSLRMALCAAAEADSADARAWLRRLHMSQEMLDAAASAVHIARQKLTSATLMPNTFESLRCVHTSSPSLSPIHTHTCGRSTSRWHVDVARVRAGVVSVRWRATFRRLRQEVARVLLSRLDVFSDEVWTKICRFCDVEPHQTGSRGMVVVLCATAVVGGVH
jgi:hypothetical protein